MALDYLLGRADELAIDPNRIVLGGHSAGATTALNIAYLLNFFGVQHPDITAVLAYSGLPYTHRPAGAVITRGAAALFIAHGTDDPVFPFERVTDLAEGAASAGIIYEFHLLSGMGHYINDQRKEALTEDGRTVETAMFEFLQRVAPGNSDPTSLPAGGISGDSTPLINVPTATEPLALPDISYFAENKSDRFLVDFEDIIAGHPYPGQRSPVPHNDAQVYFSNSDPRWINATKPSDYPPVYAVADGIIRTSHGTSFYYNLRDKTFYDPP